jgi:hypothetical protein
VKHVFLLDDSLDVEVFFSTEDKDLEDNICMKISESCKEEEKVFKHDESYLYLTQIQVREFIEALQAALNQSEQESI